MNGFGSNPNQSASAPPPPANPSSALPAPTPPIPSTAAVAGASSNSHLHQNTYPTHLNNGSITSSVTRTSHSPSPFAPSPSPSLKPTLQSQNLKPGNSRYPSTDPTSQGSTNYTLPNNNVVSGKSQDGFPPRTYPHDPNSITGKRKRADSSPVKSAQGVSDIPWAQKRQLFSEFRKSFLSALAEHDSGLSLLDKPLPSDESSHEAKKSKTLAETNSSQTLRQRLNLDAFYTSMPKLLKDVNIVTEDALAAANNTSIVAPEDEMKDDDAIVPKADPERLERIKKFQEVAQNMIAQAINQHPYLNIADEKAVAEDIASEDADSADEEIDRNYKWVVTFKSNGKKFYSSLPTMSEGKEPSVDDMDVDGLSNIPITKSDLISHARLIQLSETPITKPKSLKLKDRYPTPSRSAAIRPLAIYNEKRDREEKKKSDNSTFQWLDYGPFASFAPSFSQGGDVISAETRSGMWFQKYGQRSLEKALSEELRSQDLEANDEEEFKNLSENFEPPQIDPALFESETRLETALREISDIIVELGTTQNTRLGKHNHPTQLSKPDKTENDLHSNALERIAKILGEIDPAYCDKLHEILDMAPSLDTGVLIHTPSYLGTMPNPREAPPPPPPQPPVQAPQFTTRVSYGGDGSFTPTARVVSTRTHTPNQYSRPPTFSQQSYTPQAPPTRPQFSQAPSYYPQQQQQFQQQQQRQAIPQNSQYQTNAYTQSPFSRSSSGNVPRITSSTPQASGTPQVYITHGTTTYQQPAIRTTGGFYTQTSGQGQGPTPRRVSMVPQNQTPQRPANPPGGSYHYTPGHTQYTQMATQMQQNILRQTPQSHGQPSQAQYAYHQQQQQQQQIRPAVQSTPTRPVYPNGYQAHGRIFNTNQTPNHPSGGQQ